MFCTAQVCLLLALGAPAGIQPHLYPEHSVLRAGQEEVIWLYLEATDDSRPVLEATLTAPPGVENLDSPVRTIDAAAWEQGPVYIGGRSPRPVATQPHPAVRVFWRVRAAEPVQAALAAACRHGGETITASLDAVFLAPATAAPSDHVPDPKPADSERLVGMIYCPLWKPGDHYGWHMLEQSRPWRKPALGWYDESLPEVTDWEIKWNVEHGVDFIFYCWYRAYGNEGKPVEQMLSHGIHDGLFNARHGNRIKFCIMWTNTDYSGIADLDDLMDNLLPYWIENYFKRENYLLIDNKPLLPIYDMRRLIKDLGSNEAVRDALDRMRAACVEAGFDGLWITAESRHWWPDYLETMADCGFDASFAYCWNNVPDGASDEEAQETIVSNHKKRINWDLLPDIPTVSTMWDPSLWEQYTRDGKASAHYHATPEGFRKICEDVKALTDKLPVESLARRVVLVDNWNEWGEGHYLAPCSEHGFAYLDVLRDVFTDAPPEHEDLIPSDVGLGPYEDAYRAWIREMEKKHAEAAPAQDR